MRTRHLLPVSVLIAVLIGGCSARFRGAYGKVHVGGPWVGYAGPRDAKAAGGEVSGERPDDTPGAARIPGMGMPDYPGGFDD